jgi:alkanesulfonate monooxygenase SsuD/methylene tetrahydromethanopterin reductase-like flavin-dependent oxidoreductase (luciferase family)
MQAAARDGRRPPLRFGALLIPAAPWPVLAERCRRAEELGFDSVWLDDHIVHPATPDAPWHESWTALAGLAAQTSSIRLGVLVANAVLRHPAMLARQALTVDHITSGRLQVGLGAGHAKADHRITGQPYWPAAERAARFRECVGLVDALLRGGPVTADGQYYPSGRLQLQPASPQRPRPELTIAAHTRASLRTAAEFADTWNSFGGWSLTAAGHLARIGRLSRGLDEHCAELGRDPGSVRRSLLAGNQTVTAALPWSSAQAFDDFVGSYAEAGISEFIFYFPPELYFPAGAVGPGVVEQVASRFASYRSGR